MATNPYESKLAEIVARLHQLADDVGRSGQPLNGTCTEAAGDVVTTLTSGIANLGLHALILRAARVDNAEVEGTPV